MLTGDSKLPIGLNASANDRLSLCVTPATHW